MEPLVESYPRFAEYGDLKDITPLHWASYHGNYKVAQLLLDKVRTQILMCKNSKDQLHM